MAESVAASFLPLKKEKQMNLAINSFVSWRTTFLGIAGVVAILAKWIESGVIDWSDMPAIMASLGLVAAKDANVTGAR